MRAIRPRSSNRRNATQPVIIPATAAHHSDLTPEFIILCAVAVHHSNLRRSDPRVHHSVQSRLAPDSGSDGCPGQAGPAGRRGPAATGKLDSSFWPMVARAGLIIRVTTEPGPRPSQATGSAPPAQNDELQGWPGPAATGTGKLEASRPGRATRFKFPARARVRVTVAGWAPGPEIQVPGPRPGRPVGERLPHRRRTLGRPLARIGRGIGPDRPVQWAR